MDLARDRRGFAVALSAILLAALVLRLVFFRGISGSDDLVYFVRGLEIAEGAWTSAGYVGALRYGFNIPAGFFMWLFGPGVFSANAFSLLCSLAEIAIVGVFARSIWGAAVGLSAAALLALTPLHVGLATAIHTDPIAAFSITLSFVLFWFAEQRRRPVAYVLAGLAMGFVFWVKEVIIVYLLIFVIYAAVARRWDWRWLYVMAGGLVMLAGHLLLMWSVAGDPLHGVDVVAGRVGDKAVGASAESGAFFYARYLLIDLRHAWVVPLLAICGLVLVWRRAGATPAERYLAVWLFGLLAVFSFAPVSFSPLLLIPKQSNYLNLFFAPMAVFAALFLCAMSRRWRTAGLAVVAVGGILLAGLAQQDMRKFVSNSKAAAAFVKAHPDVDFYASVNNRNVANFLARLDGLSDSGVRSLADLERREPAGGREVWVVLDRETMSWGARARPVGPTPACWRHVRRLEPRGFGAGRTVLRGVLSVLDLAPAQWIGPVRRPFAALLAPAPADVYAVPASDLWCDQPAD